jgi:hypothetical protein
VNPAPIDEADLKKAKKQEGKKVGGDGKTEE